MDAIYEQYVTLSNSMCRNTFLETLNSEEIRFIRDKVDDRYDITTFEKTMFFCKVNKINHNIYKLFKTFMNAGKFPKHFWSRAYQIDYKDRTYNCTNSMSLMIIMNKYFKIIQESDDECINIWEDMKKFMKVCGKEYKIKREVNEKDEDYIKHVVITINDDFVKIRGLLEDSE